MENLIEGYEYFDEDELIKLVVQHPYEENQMERALKRRHIMGI